MSLSFLHGAIALLGLAAAAIPVIIHLLLKQRPRPVVFPALELIRRRHATTVRRLRLRHLILLAIRTALVLLVAFSLARPTLHSSMFSIDQEAPVAARIIVDTSLSMTYKFRGQSRLEQAKELAQQTLDRLPEGSEVAILDSSSPSSAVPTNVVAGLSRLRSIETQPMSRRLNDAIEIALRSLLTSDRDRREVYVFTDLAAHAWDLSDDGRIERVAAVMPGGVRIYVINVGVENPENIALGALALPQQVLSANSALVLEMPIRNSGAARDDLAASLSLDGVARDAKAVLLPAGQGVAVQFAMPPLNEGLHQGEISIRSGDAMAFDDTRYFSVDVRRPVRVLVASDRADDANHWINALDPAELRTLQRPRYLVDAISSDKLGHTDVAPYGVVCLLNVATVPADVWIRLAQFVQAGGGVFVSLGERILRDSYATELAGAVLPAVPDRQIKASRENSLAPKQFSHPILARFPEWGGADFDLYPVHRYWSVLAPEKSGRTIIPYADGRPALLERTFGEGKRGRCVLMTTAVHYDPNTTFWTELPTGWLYVVLADQIMRFLSGITEMQLNYEVGATVNVDLDPTESASLYAVADPQGQIDRIAADQRTSTLSVPSVRSPGQWRLGPVDQAGRMSRGFSVNVPLEESNLTPIDGERLRDIIGKDRLALARDPKTLESVIGQARVGRELFPWLMPLVLLLVFLESYFANRFYRRPANESQ